jgi:hypothetical protein
MIGYCKRCHLHTFIDSEGKCNSCSSSYYQHSQNYDETNSVLDQNTNFKRSDSTLRDMSQSENDW